MKLRVGAKISLGFALMLVLILIVGGNSYNSIKTTKAELLALNEANERLILELQIENSFKEGVASMRGFIAYGDETYYDKTKENLNKTLEMEKKLLQMAREDKKQDVVELIDSTGQYTDGLLNTLSPVVRLYHKELSAGNSEQAKQYFAEMNSIARGLIPFTTQLTETLQALVKSNHEIVNDSMGLSVEHANEIITMALIMTSISVIIGIILSVLLTRMIRNPIMEMVSGANKYAEGDFRNEITVKSSDEIGELAQSLNVMQRSFKDIVQRLNNSSNQLADSAQQLASQAQQTSAGASETASTMNEIATTVDNMSQNTQEVSGQANLASQHADKGFQGIEMVTGQMQEISTSSMQVSKSIDTLNDAIIKIGQFVEVITNIADQTNLLALNAAIEAARAGDAGRGFAVVAEEVRKLAENSAQSTKEIKQLIEEIQDQSDQAVKAMSVGAEKVKQGDQVVQDVGRSFAEIIKAVRELTDQVQNVAASAQQVSAGVQNVAGTTEEQTAAMEEVSAATESLNKLAEELKSLVYKFKI
ncbi:MAG: chemotaxis protein [Peptococcaceae bacterium BICA1-7]|nr:MAG: chemotaxis protein [Peptococcaceae bacterium BICA1-7]HBV95707.1 methyl-accepting chemotaxis protein [Desulfotomaculum sp.]